MRNRNRLLTVSLSLAAMALTMAPRAFAEDPKTPFERLKAIAPLLAERYGGVPTNKAAVAPIPATEKARMNLWADLFISHGIQGLTTLVPASADRFAQNQVGTFRLKHRFMDGKQSRQNAYQFSEMVEMRPGYAKIRTMILEAGVLEDALRQGPGDGSFRLGAFGYVVQQDVSGERYGLRPGETAVLMTFDGELYGVGYPGMDRHLTHSHIETLWVNQGDAYRTVYFQHQFFDINPNDKFMGINGGANRPNTRQEAIDKALTKNGKLSEFEEIGNHDADAMLAYTDNGYQLSYSHFDSLEEYDRISTVSAIVGIDKFWELAKVDTRLLDPAVAMAEHGHELHLIKE
jgi:hypothetical protein